MRIFNEISVFLCLMLMICSGCHSGPPADNHDEKERGDIIKYAEHLNITVHEGFTKIEIINPWQRASDLKFEYFLVKKGESVPAGKDDSEIIFTPVDRIVLMSTTYIEMMTALGKQDAIKGISGTGYVYIEDIRRRIKDGLILETGYEENLNRELLLKIKPDLIIAYGIGSESAGYLKMPEEAGIKVIYNADYLEEHPLSKAEWIKLFGALFCLEGKADSLFRKIESDYSNIRDSVKKYIQDAPKVLLGLPWQNAWYISPGNSYISNLIKDAGGRYIWEDLKSDYAVPMSLENVFVKASEAGFWLNAGNATDISEIISLDERLAGLRPVREGKVYNNNRRSLPGGGNDYWESGAISPHIILRDVASILHPGIFKGYEPVYYRKLKD
ncbi:MAG TPA: ABC transporter substrate-binding protein [Bacteroidales bacterium]|nr:ABC transporter substrate-binding protein [Bacteroidales bacterium]